MILNFKSITRIFLLMMTGFGYWINQYSQEKVEKILEHVPYRCPLRWMTGLKCAFCGMTHSWIAIFRGDFSQSFDENVLGLPLFVSWLLILFWGALGKSVKIKKTLWNFIVVLMVAYAVIRNIL